jgi:choline dehydrogenase-like flavoprotein
MSLAEAGAIERGSELEADLCIIGGGAAGIALARAFIGARQRVLLLEGGGLSFDSGAQRLCVGGSVGAPGPATAHSRFRLLGGSTARWAGQCRPLDAIDFEARDWVPFSGWPFPRAELAPWYRQAAAVCILAPAAWPDCAAAMPLGGGDLETVLYRFAHPADFGQAPGAGRPPHARPPAPGLRRKVEERALGTLVELPADPATGWPASLSGGRHHIGTTRTHADPRQGVVDPDCRVHGLANLYVAGSSVFPTAGYANPTLTIVALALRLADHLKARLD